MKKIISNIILIISFVPMLLCLIGIIKCGISGYGGFDSFGITITKKYGFEAIREYLYMIFSTNRLGIIYIPMFIVCLVYQIIYLKKLKKLT